MLMKTLDVIMTQDTNIRIRNLRRRRKYIRKRRKNAYFFLLNLQATVMSAFRDRRLWVKLRSTDWWDTYVRKSFMDSEFKGDFRVTR